MKRFLLLLFNGFLILSSSYLILQLVKMNMIPPVLLIGIMAILLILCLIILLCSFKIKKVGTTIFVCILCTVLASSLGFGGYYIQKAMKTLETVTTTTNEDEHVISILVKADSNLNELEDVKSIPVGTLSTISNDLELNVQEYSTVIELCNALYNQEIQAILFDETYRDSIQELDEFKSFETDTKIIYSYTTLITKEDTTQKVDDITLEPFTILITGTDSRTGVNTVSRSDVNLLATVNPKTGIVLLTSIPRDYYVPEVCDASEGCPNGQLDKLTHTGNHGMNCVKKTIESFMGIKINYTIKVSFESVINIVDALGGVDIYSDQDLTDAGNGNTACTITEGMNHVNGECALGFARERYAYTEGDRHRIQNQQEVLKAIAKKALSPSMILNYTDLLEAVNGTFITDLTTEEIQELIQFQITSQTEWTFEQYSLNGTGDWGYSAEMGRDLYMMYPDTTTIETGRKKIEAVLNGESSTTIEETSHDEIEVIEGWEGY